MKCKRCGQEFDTDIVELNVEAYDTHPLFACPHCGKAYRAHRRVQVFCNEVEDCDLVKIQTDDWGEKIVTDKSYNKKQAKGEK